MLSCCFIGHRNIEITDTLTNRVRAVILELLNKDVEIFYFGSRSQFNDLCYETVTELKTKFTDIQRVYVRAEYPHIDSNYTNYLLRFYEDTFYPSQLEGSGKLAYVERNRLMIDTSDYCVFYYNPNYALPNKKSKYGLQKPARSGTKLAYEYALSKSKNVLNVLQI